MKFQDLLAFRKKFDLAMDIFQLSKSFPHKETYVLTDQVRRSSRRVYSNMAETYRKRLYPKHFLSKLTECNAENSETQTWLNFTSACNYINKNTFEVLTKKSIKVGKLINYMILNPEKCGLKLKY